MASKSKSISVFVLAMMNVAVIMSLRGLPLMAKEGLPMIFFLLFSAIIFLIPTSLIAAELATAWPGGGGVYRWVREAFGNSLGFLAIWLQWIQNVIWYPTVLSFAAGALSYLFLAPELANNKLFNICIILGVFWGATIVNLRGIKASGWLTTAGVIAGTIFPGILIIVLGIVWISLGRPIEFLQVHESIFPNMSNFSNIAFLAGVLLLFAGMEVSAVHANEVKDPKKDYPKSIFLATLIIIVIFSLGALSIGAVLPQHHISLNAGIMQAFRDFLHIFHMDWLLPVIGLLVAFGAIGGVTAWIVGPSKGLFATSNIGDIPPFLEHLNKHKVPSRILYIQGGVVTALAFLYLFMPNINSAYFLLSALTVILYLIMYLLMYAAAITLRYKQPKVKRPYKIPGGIFGMWFVGIIAILGALFAIVVGFFPPSQLTVGSPVFYVLFLIIGTLFFSIIPFIIIHFRKPSWRLKKTKKARR